MADVTKYPASDTTVDGIGTAPIPFTNPQNAYASNDTRAIEVNNRDGAPNVAQRQVWYNFGFDSSGVPSGATIDGIEVEIEGYDTPGAPLDVWLTDDTGSTRSVSSESYDPTGSNAGSEVFDTLGSPTAQWGESYDATAVRGSTFGIIDLDSDSINVERHWARIHQDGFERELLITCVRQ